MKAFIQSGILIAILSGCGGAEILPALASIVGSVTELVISQTGKPPTEIPHECETEWSVDKRKFLLLCEFDVHPPER